MHCRLRYCYRALGASLELRSLFGLLFPKEAFAVLLPAVSDVVDELTPVIAGLLSCPDVDLAKVRPPGGMGTLDDRLHTLRFC